MSLEVLVTQGRKLPRDVGNKAKLACQNCGKSLSAKSLGSSEFCSRVCELAWQRKKLLILITVSDDAFLRRIL